MKTILLIILLISLAGKIYAQTPKNLQNEMDQARKEMEQLKSNPQFQQAMQKAQQAMQKMKSDTALQRQMKQSQLALDSLKKTNPALSNIQMPDLNKMQIPQLPNFDSIEQTMNKASAQWKTASKVLAQTVITPNPLHHAGQLQKLSQSALMALANSFIKQIKSGLNATDLHNLNSMLKNTKINIPGTGAFLLASGGNTSAALYLICNGILKNPKNPWAINDLGVYYRDQKNYEKALQCYLYADELDNEKNMAINTNIGWTATYYGDLITAEKYFDKALAMDPNFRSANEGEAMIAYAQGDLAALFQCLAKEIKGIGYSGGASGDAGPSDAFASFSSNAMVENEGNLDKQTTDPTNDHTFDNSNPDDGGSQNPPPGADVDNIQYPEYKKIFVNDPRQIISAAVEGLKQGIKTTADMRSRHNALMQELKTLKPLVQAPYKDDEGNLVYPNSFKKFVDLAEATDISFEKRTAWYVDKLDKKLESFRKDVINHDMDMHNQYIKASLGCLKLNGPAKDACYRQVNCTWIPKMYKSKNSDLEAVSHLWDDYYNHTFNAIQWYIDASAPFISRVHEEGWNQYLNNEREMNVRGAIIRAYGMWIAALESIASSIVFTIQQKPPSCAPVEVAGVAPDPYSKKPKHIKEFEGHCFDIKIGIGLTADINCHSTTIALGTGPLQGFYTHVDDPLYAQNHGYTNNVGFKAKAGKDLDIVKLESDENEINPLTGKPYELVPLKAAVELEGSIDLKFDNNWGFQSGSSSIGASVNALGFDVGGISATRTVEMVAGQLQVNPLSVTTTTPFQ